VSERLLATALEHVGQAVCVTPVAPDGTPDVVVYANRSYLELFCAAPADVLGRPAAWVTGPLTNGDLDDRVRDCARSARRIRVRTIEHRLDGSVFRARWRLDPVEGTGGVTHVVAAPEDVTNADRWQRRLRAVETLTAGLGMLPTTSEPCATVAQQALASALAIVVDDLGRVEVGIGGRAAIVHERRARAAADTRARLGEPGRRTITRRAVAVGRHGTVTVELLPGARALYDHHLARTLAVRTAAALDGALPTGAVGA
jgi:PAS domain S-box-containing protein